MFIVYEYCKLGTNYPSSKREFEIWNTKRTPTVISQVVNTPFLENITDGNLIAPWSVMVLMKWL